ncbi:hypothetical protein B0H14DRAFT_3455220 [Mycena olivaceomarginata]|nr:hypothetical protein B0H14DRAFT_3455220 [Mycena olivaceomarginata]
MRVGTFSGIIEGTKLPDSQNKRQRELDGEVLSLCTGFFGEIETLEKNTDPSVVAQCCPVDALQMLKEAQRMCHSIVSRL